MLKTKDLESSLTAHCTLHTADFIVTLHTEQSAQCHGFTILSVAAFLLRIGPCIHMQRLLDIKSRAVKWAGWL